MIKQFSVVTDTATIAVFDLEAIRHRMTDTADWWSIAEDEVLEMNQGNIAFLGLGEDGKFDISISDHLEDEKCALNMYFPSGQIFIGAGEDTTGGGLEPDGSAAIQGRIMSIEPGIYTIKVKKINKAVLLSFSKSANRRNTRSQSIRL
jgi:hypothetical protein